MASYAYDFCREMLWKRGRYRHAVSVCLSLCVSVCHVLEFRKNDIFKKDIFKFFSQSDSQNILVFHIKHHGDTPTGTPLTGASNAGGVGRNRDSEPISGFIACCQRCYRPSVINTAPPDRGKLWHLTQVVSGGVCWWRKTTTKCLWQGLNVTPKRNRTAFNCTQW